jgi:opacity protein-like surface antigen
MNKSTGFAVCLALLTVCVLQAGAAPRATSSRTRDFVAAGDDLRNWSCGVYGRFQERDVEVGRRSVPTTIETAKGMVYVGYAALPWMTPYLAAGLNKTEFEEVPDSDSYAEYGGGVSLRLLDTLFADPGLLEDRLRIEGNVEYTVTEAEFYGERINWGEFSASLTVGIMNEIDGNPLFRPKSIAIYAGPAFTLLTGSDLEQREGRNKFGLTAGIEVFLTERVSLYGGADVFENTGFSGGLNVRF